MNNNYTVRAEKVARKYAGKSNPDERTVANELGMKVPEEVNIELHFNSEKVNYLVFPANPNQSLSEENLEGISGGLGAETGTISTVGSIPSTIGSASSVSVDSGLDLDAEA